MNSVSLVATLAANPELRRGEAGIAECWMRLAVPRYARGGQREPGVVYVDAATSGLQAPEHAKRLSIGDRIALTGRLEPDDREPRNREKTADHVVLIDQLDFLDDGAA